MAGPMDRISGHSRLLVIPGLRGSGPGHWQSWLEEATPGALRVNQRDWERPVLDEWAARIGEVLPRQSSVQWIAVAHSFGCLALARYLSLGGQGLSAALLVAPADPHKFGVQEELAQARLPIPSILVASETDPWMRIEAARRWADRWGSHVVNLGDAGHVNVESGHGPLPEARHLIRDLEGLLPHQDCRPPLLDAA